MAKQIEIVPESERVYMRELSGLLDRSSQTIRGWERDGTLPQDLRPHRNEKGWRYWEESQVKRIREWMHKNGMAPGKGLPFEPDSDRVQGLLDDLRKPRNIEPQECPICGKPVRNLPAHERLAHPQ